MNQIKRAIQKADKYARDKEYLCLFPGCKHKAIRCHAIPRSSCVEALADKGILYTNPQSLSPLIRVTAADDTREVIEVGVNDASVFKGYCANHDQTLFAPAETWDTTKRGEMCTSLHLRATSVAYCRKRFGFDFCNKMSELITVPQVKANYQKTAEEYKKVASVFKKLYIDSVFNLIAGSNIDSIEYFIVPFSRNLQVSCCGCFIQTKNTPYSGVDAGIAFNLISYSDMSVLVLTTFVVVKHYLYSYLSDYELPKDGEKLINDIVFSRGEEPLIAAKLWRSLSEEAKLEVRLALRHPMFRPGAPELTIIKVNPSDFVSNLTSEMLTRLPTGAAADDSEEINQFIQANSSSGKTVMGMAEGSASRPS